MIVDSSYNLLDAYCVHLFPELLDEFEENELMDASSVGSYIFHEDFLNMLVGIRRADEAFLDRVCDYIENLASNKNKYFVDLAEIGVLEGLVDSGVVEIARHLGPESRRLVTSIAQRLNFDLSKWL